MLRVGKVLIARASMARLLLLVLTLAGFAGLATGRDHTAKADGECLVPPRVDILEVTRMPVNEPGYPVITGNVVVAGSSNAIYLTLYGAFACAFAAPGYEVLWDGQPIQAQPEDYATIRVLTNGSLTSYISTTPRTVQLTARVAGSFFGSSATLQIVRAADDVDCQNGVTADDVLLELQYVTGLKKVPTGNNACPADVDGKGIGISDVLHIRRVLAGLSQPLPSAKIN